jgi:outer membrane protein TolC
MMKNRKSTYVLIFIGFFSFSLFANAQVGNGVDTGQSLTLGQCIQYAMKHQPNLNEALIGLPIAKANNAINLSGWLPQVFITGDLNHYNQLPTSFVANQANPGSPPVKQHTGVVNTFGPTLAATQAIFSPQLIYASKTAPLVLKQAELDVDSARIELVVSVSKSFYNLLLTLKQRDVLREDTARLAKNVSDTYHQYIGGIVDETDYDEAAITLNNSKAQLKQTTENILPQYATLKQAMGYPPEGQFNVAFDTLTMMDDVAFDTTQQLVYEKRVELQQLKTTMDIQHLETGYYHNAWLPSLGAFFNYDYAFQNNKTSELFSNGYPYSYIGLSLSMPIFTGFARVQNERRSRLLEQQRQWGQAGLKMEINSEYTAALANYKSNLYNLEQLRENQNLAKKVYFIVDLQYKQGVVAYLNVITAESNLITAEIGYTNALFQLLSSKIDLERAMGIVPVPR